VSRLPTAINFGILAEPADAPPVLFYTMRAPCACGRSLQDCTYTFFPSTVYIHGTCEACGPQAAIFAPHMKGVQEPMSECVAKVMTQAVERIARAYGANPETILNEFFTYLADIERAAS
jgi:hypothetical protein